MRALIGSLTLVLLTAGVAMAKDSAEEKLDKRVQLCGRLAEFRLVFGHVTSMGDTASVTQIRSGWNELDNIAKDVADASRSYSGKKGSLMTAQDTLDKGIKDIPGDFDTAQAKRRVKGSIQDAHDAFQQIEQSVDCHK
jgi:hypothetical protein